MVFAVSQHHWLSSACSHLLSTHGRTIFALAVTIEENASPPPASHPHTPPRPSEVQFSVWSVTRLHGCEQTDMGGDMMHRRADFFFLKNYIIALTWQVWHGFIIEVFMLPRRIRFFFFFFWCCRFDYCSYILLNYPLTITIINLFLSICFVYYYLQAAVGLGASNLCCRLQGEGSAARPRTQH